MSDRRPEEPEDPGLESGGLLMKGLFGTGDLDHVDAILDGFCVTHLGSGIDQVLSREQSFGAVTAVRLRDGQEIVIKAHQARETLARLRAVRRIQRQLHQAGFPCPEPLIDPVALRAGHVSVEELLDRGELENTHKPACCELIAEALAWHLEITGAEEPPAVLAGGWSLFEPGRLWPSQAHSPGFDFEANRRRC